MSYSQDLKDTVEAMPHIKEVHFTANGEHYLNVHEFEGKKYGRLKHEPKQYLGADGQVRAKLAPVHTPEAEIVNTVSRDEIINSKKESKEQAVTGTNKK